VVSVTTPDKRILHQYQYDLSGNLHSAWTGETEYTEYTYNAAGKTVGVYTGKGQAEKREAAQSFQHDALGNITGVRDGNENLTQFVLDDWGRITEVYTPDGGIERYAYDYAGNIISTTDANGGTITYKYNSFGQVYERVDQEGISEYFYYDEEGRPALCIDRNDNHIQYGQSSGIPPGGGCERKICHYQSVSLLSQRQDKRGVRRWNYLSIRLHSHGSVKQEVISREILTVV